MVNVLLILMLGMNVFGFLGGLFDLDFIECWIGDENLFWDV